MSAGAIGSRLPPALQALAILAAAAIVAALLVWEHANGGIPSHHLLHRRDLPSVSNLWGLLVWPALAWLALARIARRSTPWPIAATGFASGLACGVALSLAFVGGHESLTAAFPLALLALAVLLPVFRAECAFGFVAAMTPVFGAVLPGLFVLVMLPMTAALHLAPRWLIATARQRRAIAG